MTIHLDHTIVPSRSQVASARRLAELLGVEWAETALGPFSAVYINDGLTLDFIQTDEDFPVYHFCFRVDDAELSRDYGPPMSCCRGTPTAGRFIVHPISLLDSGKRRLAA